MIDKVIPFLNKAIPLGLALKGIKKADSRIGSFLEGAIASGYGADQVIDYLRDKVANPAVQDKRAQIQQLEQQGIARPDERALGQSLRQDRIPGDLLQEGAKLGASALGGLGAAGLIGRGEQRGDVQVLPPELPPAPDQPPPANGGLPYKGTGGYVANDEYLRPPLPFEKNPPPPMERPAPAAPRAALIIPKHSKAMHEYIIKELDSGRSLDEAGALAQFKYEKLVNKMERKEGIPFSDILENDFPTHAQQQVEAVEAQSKPQAPQMSADKQRIIQSMDRLAQLLGGG